MITVTDAVRSTLLEDDIGLQAAQAGVLNLSAYAERILPAVEQATHKDVKKGTVVVALARITEQVSGLPSLRPDVILDDLSIKFPLCSATFRKTALTRQKLASLHQAVPISENAFFTLTQSISEITIIAPQSLFEEIFKHFEEPPVAIYKDRVAITVRFAEAYLAIPNILYTLQATLAVHRINFTEVVSTYTEFSFIIAKQDLETASLAMQKLLR